MLIKGMQKTSLIDYPGKISSIIFTAGCDFRCPYCHNADLVLNPEKLPTIKESEVLEILESRKKWIDGLSITGGEPCMQSDLPEFVRRVKELGLLVKLDTNGSMPGMLERMIKSGNLDYIAMDVKAPLTKRAYKKASGVDVDVDKIRKSIKLIIKSGLEHEFRTTVLPRLLAKGDIVNIARSIKGGKRFYVQQFRAKKTLEPSFQKCKQFSGEELDDIREECNKHIPTEIRK